MQVGKLLSLFGTGESTTTVYFLLNFFFTISCSQKLTFASFEFFRIRNTLSNNINISK